MTQRNTEYFKSSDNMIMLWLTMFAFAIAYPIFISFYTILPLFIGLAGYIMIDGIKKGSLVQIFISFIYLVNVDINTSIPIFSSSIAVLLCYLLVLPSILRLTATHKAFASILTVIFIYIIYFITIFIFDFIVDIDSIRASLLILISIMIDILLVIFI